MQKSQNPNVQSLNYTNKIHAVFVVYFVSVCVCDSVAFCFLKYYSTQTSVHTAKKKIIQHTTTQQNKESVYSKSKSKPTAAAQNKVNIFFLFSSFVFLHWLTTGVFF